METTTVGKVLVAAKFENVQDLTRVKLGLLPADQVRSVEVADALVDTGATMLSLPQARDRSTRLGPRPLAKFRTTSGPAEFGIYDVVRLTIQGRECKVEVSEVPDDCPVLDRPDSAGSAGLRRRSHRTEADRQPGTRRRAHGRFVPMHLTKWDMSHTDFRSLNPDP